MSRLVAAPAEARGHAEAWGQVSRDLTPPAAAQPDTRTSATDARGQVSEDLTPPVAAQLDARTSTADARGQVSQDLTPPAAAQPDARTSATDARGQVSQDLTPPAAAQPGAPQAFAFGCDGETLLGVLHPGAVDAPAAAGATGVVVVVGGPQYRAGSHRQFVHLARALAAAGHPVLRFDVRGMGDSSGALRNFEQITPDIGAAIDQLLQRAPGVRRVVLWGLCDGASAALLYLHERRDPRVAGLCLLNPWVRSEASLARTHVKHYYTRRLREPAFWLKLLRGGVGPKALGELWRSVTRARGGAAAPGGDTALPFQQRMLQAWQRFDGRVLLALSGDDYTAKEFVETCAASADWQRLLQRPTTRREDLPGADHTLSTSADRDAMNRLTLAWLREVGA